MLGGRPCWLLAVALAACTHHARPVVAGSELYAKLDELDEHGQVTLQSTERKPVVVKFGQVLETEDARATYAVETMIENCREQRPYDDEPNPSCLLESMKNQRFRVLDRAKDKGASVAREDDEGMSRGGKILLGAAVVAAPLVAGVVACDSDDCRALMYVGLGADALLALILALGLH